MCARDRGRVVLGRGPGRQDEQRVSGENDAGYAIVDALVALVLFASILSLGLAADLTAAKLGERAREVERVRSELVSRLEAAPTKVGVQSGRSGDLAWTVTVEAPNPSVAEDLCRVAVDVTPAKGRAVKLATLRPCKVSS